MTHPKVSWKPRKRFSREPTQGELETPEVVLPVIHPSPFPKNGCVVNPGSSATRDLCPTRSEARVSYLTRQLAREKLFRASFSRRSWVIVLPTVVRGHPETLISSFRMPGGSIPP